MFYGMDIMNLGTFHFYLVSRSLNKINWKDGAIPKSEYNTSTDYMREARRGKQYVWIYQAVAAGGVVSSGRGEVSSGRGLAW